MIHAFTANAEIKGGPDRAARTLDAFRESARPGAEHGIVLFNLRPAGSAPDAYLLDVEIEAEDAARAEARFDAFREAEVPSDHGVVLFGLRPAADAGRA